MSEDVQGEVVSLIELLLVPVVETPARGAVAEDALATVEIAVVRPLDLGNDALLARVKIEPVVERLGFKPVAGNLGRDVGPMEIIGPILGTSRTGTQGTQSEQGTHQRERLEQRSSRHDPPPCRQEASELRRV